MSVYVQVFFSIRERLTVDAQGVLAMGSVQSSAVCPLHFRSVFCSSVSGGVPVFFPACSWVLPLGVRARPTLLPCLDPAFSFFFARDPKRGNMRTLFEFVIFILVTSFLFPAKIICWELYFSPKNKLWYCHHCHRYCCCRRLQKYKGTKVWGTSYYLI